MSVRECQSYFYRLAMYIEERFNNRTRSLTDSLRKLLTIKRTMYNLGPLSLGVTPRNILHTTVRRNEPLKLFMT